MASDLETDLDDLPPLEDLPDSGPPRRRGRPLSDEPSSSLPSASPGPKRKTKPPPSKKGPQARSHEWWLHEFNEMAAKGSFALGQAAENVLPTTSSVLQVRAPVVGDAVEEAARRDSRVFAVARAVYDSQIYVLFITTLGAILLAIAIDLGRMPVYAVDIDEGHVAGVNPLARFALPKESLNVAIGVQRRHQQQRAATAAAQPPEPVSPPAWYGGGGAGAEGVVGGAQPVAGR
jgi:hypothetical protein